LNDNKNLRTIYTMSLSVLQKLSATLQSIIVFVLVSMPATYRLTNRYLGGIIGKLADPSGCPTTLGLFVHAIVFALVVYGLMVVRLRLF